MEEIEYKIYKYELCPSNDPNRIIIGFMITDITNNRSLNVEETIPLVDSAGKDEEEVCQMAYERVKDTIGKWHGFRYPTKWKKFAKMFQPLPVSLVIKSAK